MGALKDWVKQDWVRIGTDGKIKGKCGTSKDKKNPDRCLPRSKAQSLSKKERASTAKKKKKEGAKGKTVVSNTKRAKVRNKNEGGVIEPFSKRKFNGKSIPNTAVARGCGKVMSSKRKRTQGAVTQS